MRENTGEGHPLVGAWRTVSTSDEMEDGRSTTQAIEGFVIFTASRVAVLYGSAEPGYKLAYTGAWRAEAGQIQIDVDFSTSPTIAKQLVRFFSVDGAALVLKTPRHESKQAPGVWKTSYLNAVRPED